MKTSFVSVLLFLLVTGCTSTKVNPLDYVETSKGNSVDFYLYGVGDDSINTEIKKLIEGNGGNMSEHCPASDTMLLTQEALVPSVIPLVTSLGKYLFDRFQNRKIKELKELKQAATSTYSGNAFLSSTRLKNARCAILVRNYMENGKKHTGLIVVANIEHYTEDGSQVFFIQPTFVKVYKPAVKTKKVLQERGKAIKHSKVNLAIGFALKAIGIDRNSGLSKLDVVGSGASSVSNVELPVKAGDQVTNPCKKPCSHSDLIPHIDDGQPISISMSVTELGQVGIDFDQRIAEITAIKEAFGPAIKESLKEALSDD